MRSEIAVLRYSRHASGRKRQPGGKLSWHSYALASTAEDIIWRVLVLL